MAARAALVDGAFAIPAALGLTAVAPHIDRSERDCLLSALPMIASTLGPAGRLVDAGAFETATMASLLTELERPKAAIMLRPDMDPRHHLRLSGATTTAEISHIEHDVDDLSWSLESAGDGRTLVAILGGGFGLYDRETGFDVLDHIGDVLKTGDLVLLTLEQPKDGAVLEALYLDTCTAIVTQALNKIGRYEGLEPRLFFDAMTHVLHYGALARENALIAWNGTMCPVPEGTWLEVGQFALTDIECGSDLHPDFAVESNWTAPDGHVSLLLLRKL
jgi:hypothetical protein